MIEAFFGMAMITLGVSLVLAIPLWVVSLWKRKGKVAAWFVGVAGVVGVVFGLATASTESLIESCEVDGGIGCGDAYFGLFGLWFLFLAGYFVAALVAAFVIVWRSAGPEDPQPEHLWCEECSDLVAVEGHQSGHTLRRMHL